MRQKAKMLTISQVKSDSEIMAVRDLIREFSAWVFTLQEVTKDAPTFNKLDEELATLPGIYAPPTGQLLLAMADEQPAGCIAFKKHNSRVCELKRMYVRSTFRGQKIGLNLVKVLMEKAQKAGFECMVLDSHISMKKAHQLYQENGFNYLEGPEDFPIDIKPTVVFMECDLMSNT